MDGWMYSIPSHGAMKVMTGKKKKKTRLLVINVVNATQEPHHLSKD